MRIFPAGICIHANHGPREPLALVKALITQIIHIIKCHKMCIIFTIIAVIKASLKIISHYLKPYESLLCINCNSFTGNIILIYYF